MRYGVRLTGRGGEPSTQLVSVIGEPGIGKSRLVDELFAYIEELPELITWRRGRSLSYGEGVAFWALGEIVKAQAGILESDSASVAEEKLSAAVAQVIVDEGDRGWVARHLRPLVGLEAAPSGGDSGRVEAFAAWRRFLEALAEDRPTVLVFEDIHWADNALLDFIDLVADRAGAIPLLVVCTARPELFERREHWGGGKTNATTISLTPLSDEDTARLVGGLLDQALLPAEVQETLLERAEGNPLYAQEYVRMLQDRGVLVRGEGGWVLAGDVVDLPESLQGIIAARLDTLSPDEKGLLQDAAVVGKTAWIGAVNALSDRSTWQAEELLYNLERKQLVQRVRRSSIQGETEFVFGHAITKDVAYSQIRRADRATKHEAAAEWIERLAGERDDKAELLADHYHQALELRTAMGETIDAVAPRALAAFTEAANQAAATYAHAAAARHFEAALALAPPSDDNGRAALLLGHATALSNAEIATPEILEAAIEAQIAVEDWDAAAQIERMLGRRYQDSGESERGDVHLARAADYASRVPPSDTMCMIAYDQAWAMVTGGKAEQGLALVDQMIPLAEDAGLVVGRAMLLVWRGQARISLGDAEGGIADTTTGAETLAHEAHPRAIAAYGNLGNLLFGLGRMSQAAIAYTTAAEWAGRFELPGYASWVALLRSQAAYHAGEWDAAEHLIAFAGAADHTPFEEHELRGITGRIALARGVTDAALKDASAIIAYAEGSRNDQYLYKGLALEARCQQSLGNHDAGLDACSRFLARWHEGDIDAGEGPMALCELSPLLVRADRHGDIRTAALRLSEACRWRDALLLTAEGRYAEAADVYTEIGSLPFAADAHLLAADHAAQQGRHAGAAHHAAAVVAFAERTGAVLYQRQADR
jgi:tetratricopeptide (TPR) repeat protein